MVRALPTETFQRLEGIRDAITLHTGDLLDQRSLVDVHARLRARGDLQPRRDVVRGGVVVAAGADRRVHRHGRDPHARGDARGLARRRASTRRPPRRCSGRCSRSPQRETDPVLPALSLRGGQVLRPLHHRQLPRVATTCSPCSGILFNHESERRGLEFVTRKVTPRRGRDQARPAGRAGARQPRRRARLGLRQGLRRGDVADAPAGRAGRLRDRHRRGALGAGAVDVAFAHVGLDPDDHVRIDPKLPAPGRGRAPDRRPRPRRATSSAGAETSFEEMVKLMVDSDLELLARGVPQKQAG